MSTPAGSQRKTKIRIATSSAQEAQRERNAKYGANRLIGDAKTAREQEYRSMPVPSDMKLENYTPYSDGNSTIYDGRRSREYLDYLAQQNPRGQIDRTGQVEHPLIYRN